MKKFVIICSLLAMLGTTGVEAHAAIRSSFRSTPRSSFRSTPRSSFKSTPKPSTPKPSTPKPSVPKPSVPKPSVPKPSVPKPSVPKPSVPKPTTPKVVKPKVTAPKTDKSSSFFTRPTTIVQDTYSPFENFWRNLWLFNLISDIGEYDDKDDDRKY